MEESVKLLLKKSMTKKDYKLFCTKYRSTVSCFNTGERVIKNPKDYNRKVLKRQLIKEAVNV